MRTNASLCVLALAAWTDICACSAAELSQPPGSAITVAVSPKSSTVLVGGSAAFTARVERAVDVSVVWSVLEGTAGGKVDSNGVYTAPLQPGVYHVVATAAQDSRTRDSAEVTVTAPATDLATQLQVLSRKSIVFGHQSVGVNIITGIRALLAGNTGPEPVFLSTRTVAGVAPGIFAEFGVGQNMFPAGKISDFVAVMDGGLATVADIAFFKYCFVDFYDSAEFWRGGTPVSALFDQYKAALGDLATAHPNVRFVHVTVPLVHVDLFPFTGNDRREAYSDLVRAAYLGKEAIFDLARIQSTKPDGVTRCYDPAHPTVPALCPEYGLPGDDGHLNALGENVVARALVAFLAALP